MVNIDSKNNIDGKKKNWFISDKNIDQFFFKRLLYTHMEQVNVELQQPVKECIDICIHLITYLTSKLFWIYTVFRYNTILYPKDEDTQKLFAYFCAYLLSCWGSMQWGTMYGDLIFELIALLIITVAYQADWQHHIWNTLMVYIMGIL